MVMNYHRHNSTRIRKLSLKGSMQQRYDWQLPSEIFFDSEQTDYCYEDTDQCVTLL